LAVRMTVSCTTKEHRTKRGGLQFSLTFIEKKIIFPGICPLDGGK